MMVDDAATLAELQARFEAYERALGENDVEVLDGFFWESPAAVRFGATESLYGFAAIAAFRAARGRTPPRTLRGTQVSAFGTDYGVTVTEFVREGESRLGRQTQVWVRFAEAGWKIVSAHVSWCA